MTVLSVDIPVIQTGRLTLRAQSEADLPATEAFYASDRARFVGGTATPSEVWSKWVGGLGHWLVRGYGRWTIEFEGQPAGWAAIIYPAGWPEPELGWGVFEGFEGKGLAYEGALAARDYAYGTLGLGPLISLIDPANARSEALASRLGATPESTTEIHGKPCRIWRHPGKGAL